MKRSVFLGSEDEGFDMNSLGKELVERGSGREKQNASIFVRSLCRVSTTRSAVSESKRGMRVPPLYPSGGSDAPCSAAGNTTSLFWGRTRERGRLSRERSGSCTSARMKKVKSQAMGEIHLTLLSLDSPNSSPLDLGS